MSTKKCITKKTSIFGLFAALALFAFASFDSRANAQGVCDDSAESAYRITPRC
jgi:hypothetical protein